MFPRLSSARACRSPVVVLSHTIQQQTLSLKEYGLNIVDASWSKGSTRVVSTSAACCRSCFSTIDPLPAESRQQDDRFLSQVEATIDRVLETYNAKDWMDYDVVLSLPGPERESVLVARRLWKRLSTLHRKGGCRRCWLQQAHCICDSIGALQLPLQVNRIFLLTHHKEIGLAVDTAKLILAAYPTQCRLVVGGIPAKFQDSMGEMEGALTKKTTIVLFPAENSVTYQEFVSELGWQEPRDGTKLDLIVLDGTWEQARRLFKRYIPTRATKIQLSIHDGLDQTGRQMRPHPIPVREIATSHALQLLLRDMDVNGDEVFSTLDKYHAILRVAVNAQLADQG
jgi:DTW domain-containing protein YfiP